jgi:hypothetical protein
LIKKSIPEWDDIATTSQTQEDHPVVGAAIYLTRNLSRDPTKILKMIHFFDDRYIKSIKRTNSGTLDKPISR